MICLENVSKNYSNGVEALKNINMKIEDGEFVFIVGDSGSGKSTLIKLLLKELEPSEGTIEVDGIVLNKMKRRLFQCTAVESAVFSRNSVCSKTEMYMKM